MDKCKYAGLTILGFLLDLICAAGTLATLFYIQQVVGMTLFAGLLLTAGTGVLFRLMRRAIRNKLNMKTTLFSLITVLLPIVLGIVGMVLGANNVFTPGIVDFLCFFGGLIMIVTAIFSGLFGSTLDKLYS